MSTAMPPLPSHLRRARARICAALGALDQSSWRFTFQPPALFAVRVWPRAAVDTLVVVGPEVVHARRDVIGVGPVWSAEGTVERMVTEINALGCPHDPGEYPPAGPNPNPGSTP